jgi:hypothetical protein
VRQPVNPLPVSTGWESLSLPQSQVGKCDTAAATGGHHPYRQYGGAEQADGQDQQDDTHSAYALVARQIWEKQLARMFYKMFSHIQLASGFSGLSGRSVPVRGISRLHAGKTERTFGFSGRGSKTVAGGLSVTVIRGLPPWNSFVDSP